MKLRRLFLALLLAGGVHVITAAPASACSCVSPPSEVEYLGRASAVFVGELVRYTPPAPQPTMSSLDEAIWTFDVSAVYKGEVAATQDVASPVSGASCGLELPHVGRFLVYAYSKPGDGEEVPGQVLYSGLCDGTRAVSDAPIPATLGQPQAPLPTTRSADLSRREATSLRQQPGASESGGPSRAGAATSANWATVAAWSSGGLTLALAGLLFARHVVAPRRGM